MCSTAKISFGKNEVHRMPHGDFDEKTGKEDGEGKKKKRMCRCTWKFNFIRHFYFRNFRIFLLQEGFVFAVFFLFLACGLFLEGYNICVRLQDIEVGN